MSNGHPPGGAPSPASPTGPGPATGPQPDPAAPQASAELPRLELYAHGASEAGRAARQHVERLHAQRLGGTAELAIFDLDRSPVAAQNARILLTPALIYRGPRGERRCFGDFGELDRVCEALGLGAPEAKA